MKRLLRKPLAPPIGVRIDRFLVRNLDQAFAALAHSALISPIDVLEAPAGRFENLRHELSDHYVARSRHQVRVRTPIESRVAEGFEPRLLSAAMRSAAKFRSFLLQVGQGVATNVRYRDEDACLAPDASGVIIELPPADEAKTTLEGLRLFLRSQPESPSLASTAALALIVNAHPLTDGNGRTARVMFNCVLQSYFPSIPYLPLSEIFQRSDGGYEIALRQAEIRGKWEPLLEFLTGAAEFCSRQSDVIRACA